MKKGKELLSVKYGVAATFVLTAGDGRPQTTNVRLRPTKLDPRGRWVGIHSLDLLGDQSHLAGREVRVSVEEIQERKP